MKTNLRILIAIELMIICISPVYARNSASQTLTIRIVRSSQVSIDPVQKNLHTDNPDLTLSAEQNFRMNWLAHNNQTKISVTADKKDPDAALLLNNNGQVIEINDNNVDLLPPASEIKGNCQFFYQNRDKTQATVFYTMTDV